MGYGWNKTPWVFPRDTLQMEAAAPAAGVRIWVEDRSGARRPGRYEGTAVLRQLADRGGERALKGGDGPRAGLRAGRHGRPGCAFCCVRRRAGSQPESASRLA